MKSEIISTRIDIQDLASLLTCQRYQYIQTKSQLLSQAVSDLSHILQGSGKAQTVGDVEKACAIVFDWLNQKSSKKELNELESVELEQPFPVVSDEEVKKEMEKLETKEEKK